MVRLGAKISLSIITGWMQENGLTLAVNKTEAVILAGPRKFKNFNISFGDENISTSPSIKYLGVLISRNLNFSDHIKFICEKTAIKISNLSKILPNMRGPNTAKRKILCSVAESTILYAAPVWAHCLQRACHRARLLSIQRRGALRLARAYRTVSTEAALTISGLIPIDLVIKERHRRHLDRFLSKETVREASLLSWQQRWSMDTGKAKWTKTLLKNVVAWYNRKHGELDYHLTQILSGHGCFGNFLFRIGKRISPSCVFCEAPNSNYGLNGI